MTSKAPQTSIIEVDLEALIKNRITIEQYAICYLLWQDSIQDPVTDPHTGERRPLTYIYRYFNALEANKDIKGWRMKDIEYLEERGFLVNNNPPGHYGADLMEVTEKFKAEVLCAETEFQEFWDAYPTTGPLGPDIPNAKLRTGNYYELADAYFSVVGSKKKHQRVMEALQWAIDNDELRVGIYKFIMGREWEAIEQIRQGKTSGTYDPETLL